jgi:AAHS family benzoate transporter-like MFS transporter
MSSVERGRVGGSLLVVFLCFLVLLSEGYDLAMFGSVVPSLRADAAWKVSAEMAGLMGSAGVLGMLLGAGLAAVFADRVGRRPVVIGAVATFSIGMALGAVAPTPEVLLGLRLLVGLGAGMVMPTAAATLIEFAPPNRRSLWTALGFVGVGVGGVLAGMVSLTLVENYGWRSMFAVGALPLVTVLPLLLARFPESVQFLVAAGRPSEAQVVSERFGVPLPKAAPASENRPAEQVESNRFREVFADGRALGTVLFWFATTFCLLITFGISAWLPDLLKDAGYGLQVALGSLVALKTGAVVGTLAGGWLCDLFGQKRVVTATYLVTGLSLLGLTVKPSAVIAYLLIGLLGFGTTGLQTLINAYVGTYYPARVRATGLGLNLSIGRLGGVLGPIYLGLLVAAGLSFSSKFYALAVPALIGALFVAFIPQRRTGAPEPEVRHRPATAH